MWLFLFVGPATRQPRQKKIGFEFRVSGINISHQTKRGSRKGRKEEAGKRRRKRKKRKRKNEMEEVQREEEGLDFWSHY